MNQTVILVMTVEIGDGRTDTIEVAEDDQPDILAKAFCRKHNLAWEYVDVLASQIEANIDTILEEDAQLKAEDWSFASKEQTEISVGEFNRLSDLHSEVSSSETLNAQFQSLTDYSRVSSRNSSVSSSAGNRLYYLGVMKKEQSKQWRKKQIQHQDEQTSKTLTFKPAINSRSKSLAKNHRRAEDSFTDLQRKRLEGIERRKGQSLAEQQSECTFVPRVNRASEGMVSRNSAQKNAFMNLFAEAKERQQRLQEAKDSITKAECPFKPSINSSKGSRSVSRDQDVVDRLVNSNVMKESNLQRIRDKQAALVDPHTGQEFFKPKIGRAPRQGRNSENLPIGVYLHSHCSRETSKMQEASTYIELLSKPRSTQIIEKLKLERFKELFEMLNPNESGEIVSHNIEPEKLSDELLSTLFPLLEELEQLGEPINFAEFSEAMENLLLTLTPGEKSMILMPRRTVPVDNAPSHIPQINDFQPSTILHKQLSQLPIYERQTFLTHERQRRLEEAKTKKQQAELEQCTFHPKIKSYRMPEASLDQESELSFVVSSFVRQH